ncbi:type II secretion system F family protein [Croceivirga radicis]|uniref:type II secretion system F family protein n=1 Tax=Croceivirga radicis TaxID=1929488 RepID=UPI000255B21C|nr:type II secretion system F family protein [Croceivirga radicis]
MRIKLNDTKTAKSATNVWDIEDVLKKEISLFGHFFNSKVKESFYNELGILLKAGVNLRDGLKILIENQKKEKLKNLYEGFLVELDNGVSLSEIFKKNTAFTEYEHHSVNIGEETGRLSDVIESLADYFQKKNQQNKNVINALIYPMIISVTAILVVVFMLRTVVPMFEDIFKQNGLDLPPITKSIISLSNFIGNYGLYLLLILIIYLLFRKILFKQNTLRKRRDYLLLKLPIIGGFYKSIYITRFTHAMALLTAANVPILRGVKMVSLMIDFYPLREALNKVEKDVIRGESLHASMASIKLFDSKLVALIKVAEETNKTNFVFEKLSMTYSKELEQKSKLMSMLLEPIIIVFIGLMVGVILVSMYLPMFKLSNILG